MYTVVIVEVEICSPYCLCRPKPPHPSDRRSICRYTACCRHLRSTSAGNRDRKKETSNAQALCKEWECFIWQHCFFPSGYVIIITENTLTPLSVQSTLNTLSSWAARSYRGALQLWHTKKESQVFITPRVRPRKRINVYHYMTEARVEVQQAQYWLPYSALLWQRQEIYSRWRHHCSLKRVEWVGCPSQHLCRSNTLIMKQHW